MSTTAERIENDFNYHQPDDAKAELHASVRTALREAAEFVAARTPACREQSLALTKLEEAMFWANAALARN